MKQTNIMCLVPDMADSTSWYRAVGPLGHLKNHSDLNLNFLFAQKTDFRNLKAQLCMHHILFAQRPFTQEHVNTIEQAKDQGVRVWVDYDDDLFTVPYDNPTYPVYGRKEVKENVYKCLQLADHVTVSTDYLKNKYELINSNITVIKNSFNPFHFPFRDEHDNYNNVVMWRGSNTHHQDVMTVAGQILDSAERHQDFEFEFVGDRLWFLSGRMRNAVITNFMDIVPYHKHIYARSPKVFIVPLHFSDFNRAKSNIAWLEATFSGAITIAPKMPEWEVPGVLHYESQVQFGNALETAITMNKEKHHAMVTEAWQYAIEHHNLDVVNNKRIEVINKLMEYYKR